MAAEAFAAHTLPHRIPRSVFENEPDPYIKSVGLNFFKTGVFVEPEEVS